MTALTFRNICDPNSLLKLINNCNGPVYLQSAGDERIDLRENSAIMSLLAEVCGKSGIEKMSVIIYDKQDMPRIIDYLLSCNRTPVIM
jgi:hypothetical protein